MFPDFGTNFHSYAGPDFKRATKLIRELENADLRTCDQAWIHDSLLTLSRGARMYGMGDISKENVWFRAQQCREDRFENLHRMIYPPAEIARIGRANVARQPMHYASWNQGTAFSEMHAKAGDRLQLIAVRAIGRQPVNSVVVGELAYFLQTGGRSLVNAPFLSQMIDGILRNADPEWVSYWQLIDSFFAHIFRKDVLPGAEGYEYKLSATLAARIANTNGALMFPSVRTFGSMNVAIPATIFDSSFEVLCTWVVRIRESHGFSVYQHDVEHFTNTFEADGRILWEKATPVDANFSNIGGVKVGPHTKGWQVPRDKAI